jgi:hypothetical protein
MVSTKTPETDPPHQCVQLLRDVMRQIVGDVFQVEIAPHDRRHMPLKGHGRPGLFNALNCSST